MGDGKSQVTKREGINRETKYARPDRGQLHEVKGKIKEHVGRATNDPDLEVSGKAEKNAGKVQKWIGNAEKVGGE
jgi:uncharacterized protein YjbJ (UPF0337 family)